MHRVVLTVFRNKPSGWRSPVVVKSVHRLWLSESLASVGLYGMDSAFLNADQKHAAEFLLERTLNEGQYTVFEERARATNG